MEMFRIILTLCLLVATCQAYSIVILNTIKSLNNTQQAMLKRISELEKFTTESKIDPLKEEALEKAFEDQLAMLERRVSALMNYLAQEKMADIKLKKNAKNTIDEMKEKVTKSDRVIDVLEEEVRKSITDFDAKIDKVNKTAHLTVNVKGVVFIDGIGSSCSEETDACKLPHSQCRDRKCQCDLGYSFDNELNECTKDCKDYGCTFQSVKRRVIRDFNNKVVVNVTLAECKELCIEETDFVCKSFDYFRGWDECYLSDMTKIKVPEKKWEYNSAGDHFQRDCLGIRELSLCKEREP